MLFDLYHVIFVCDSFISCKFRFVGMLYCRLDIATCDEFVDVLTHMKNLHIGEYTSTLEYYRAVDNMIFVCHGHETGITFDPSDSYEGINNTDFITDDAEYPGLDCNQSAPINVVDYIACYSAVNPDDNSNIAYTTLANCNVRETYGWSGRSFFGSRHNMNYSDWPFSGRYIRYYRDGVGTVQHSSVPIEMIRPVGFSFIMALYVDSNLHSTDLAGG